MAQLVTSWKHCQFIDSQIKTLGDLNAPKFKQTATIPAEKAEEEGRQPQPAALLLRADLGIDRWVFGMLLPLQAQLRHLRHPQEVEATGGRRSFLSC
ncbi:hypothetical protein TcasGA2_TC014805 [Tribolium castaneum]|uniref:Uncharacterized protein n=1 Tax=Tribolium castaneum TaxID=7070 RepID=D6WJU7_TRICA|nr:hypothetical protein TcasGA2_TC014805 [Tribolium castaneum]